MERVVTGATSEPIGHGAAGDRKGAIRFGCAVPGQPGGTGRSVHHQRLGRANRGVVGGDVLNACGNRNGLDIGQRRGTQDHCLRPRNRQCVGTGQTVDDIAGVERVIGVDSDRIVIGREGRGVGAAGQRVRCQQARIGSARHCAEREIDAQAGPRLQRPAAAQCGRTDRPRRCRHAHAEYRFQMVDEALSGSFRRHRAAIQQDGCRRIQCCGDACQIQKQRVQYRSVDGFTRQQQRTGLAVAENMQGDDAVPAFQIIGNLPETVSIRRQMQNIHVRTPSVE